MKLSWNLCLIVVFKNIILTVCCIFQILLRPVSPRIAGLKNNLRHLTQVYTKYMSYSTNVLKEIYQVLLKYGTVLSTFKLFKCSCRNPFVIRIFCVKYFAFSWRSFVSTYEHNGIQYHSLTY